MASSSALVCPKDFRVEFYDGATELKWCLFVDGKRGSIGKLITTILSHFVSESLTAKIKSLFIKPQYRGLSLGLVLLDKCLRHLSSHGFVAVSLDAEEEVTRHGKLVSFYEGCGFAVTAPLAKPRLMYNGDQCLRVIPMDCRLPHCLTKRHCDVDSMREAHCIVDDERSLLHVLRMRHTLRFVQRMEEECMGVSRAAMSLVEAMLACGSADPDFLARRLACMRFAKAAGQPDFVQLAVLIFSLGQIQRQFEWKTPQLFVDESTKDESKERDPSTSKATSTPFQGELKHPSNTISASDALASPTQLDNEAKHSSSGLELNNKAKHSSGGLELDNKAKHSTDGVEVVAEQVPFASWAAVPGPHETWVVGCALPETLEESSLNLQNPDMQDKLLSSDVGCYRPACGMAAVHLCWSDQEYLWQVLRNKNHVPIPDDALSALRFQRLFSWTDHDAYSVLADGEDDEEARFWTCSIRDLVRDFDNQYVGGEGELATEEGCRQVLECEAGPIIDKYVPGVLQW
jgi:GNAT superfamily N-acetyltransferase